MSLWVVADFDVSAAARIGFVAEALLWIATTVLGVREIRRGRVAEHRRWMIRSVAVAWFFITFSLWEPVLAATPVPADVGYPASVVLGWAVNLLVAELWIRRTRT